MKADRSNKRIKTASLLKGHRKWLFIDAALLILVLMTGLLMARYVSAHKVKNEMIAAGFHFSSSELKEKTPADAIPEGGMLTVDIRNYEVENRYNISGMKGNGEEPAEYELPYYITAKNKSSDQSLPQTSSSNQYITVMNEHSDPSDDSSAPSEEASTYDSSVGAYTYTLTADGTSKDVHHVTMDLTPIAAVGAYGATLEAAQTAATSSVNVKTSSLSPYIKELNADYSITGIAVTKEEVGGNVSRLVIRTNNYEGPLKIAWQTNTFPAAGVNEYAYGWEVNYDAYGSNHFARQIVQRHTTYCFEYNTSEATGIYPSVSGSWAYYDENSTASEEIDKWSGGAEISAGV